MKRFLPTLLILLLLPLCLAADLEASIIHFSEESSVARIQIVNHGEVDYTNVTLSIDGRDPEELVERLLPRTAVMTTKYLGPGEHQLAIGSDQQEFTQGVSPARSEEKVKEELAQNPIAPPELLIKATEKERESQAAQQAKGNAQKEQGTLYLAAFLILGIAIITVLSFMLLKKKQGNGQKKKGAEPAKSQARQPARAAHFPSPLHQRRQQLPALKKEPQKALKEQSDGAAKAEPKAESKKDAMGELRELPKRDVFSELGTVAKENRSIFSELERIGEKRR